MAHDGKPSPLMFGLIKPKNNISNILWVLLVLTVVTVVEVALGIVKPASLHLTSFLGTSPLNWIFIILTLVKAYWITWYFMHMDGEHKWFRRSIVWTSVFLICYLTFILLVEGNYLHSVLSPYVNWEY